MIRKIVFKSILSAANIISINFIGFPVLKRSHQEFLKTFLKVIISSLIFSVRKCTFYNIIIVLTVSQYIMQCSWVGLSQLMGVVCKRMCARATADQEDEFSLWNMQLLSVVGKNYIANFYKKC